MKGIGLFLFFTLTACLGKEKRNEGSMAPIYLTEQEVRELSGMIDTLKLVEDLLHQAVDAGEKNGSILPDMALRLRAALKKADRIYSLDSIFSDSVLRITPIRELVVLALDFEEINTIQALFITAMENHLDARKEKRKISPQTPSSNQPLIRT